MGHSSAGGTGLRWQLVGEAVQNERILMRRFEVCTDQDVSVSNFPSLCLIPFLLFLTSAHWQSAGRSLRCSRVLSMDVCLKMGVSMSPCSGQCLIRVEQWVSPSLFWKTT